MHVKRVKYDKFKEHYHWSKIGMNQNETIVGHDESVTVDAELFPYEKREKEREDCIIVICICYAVNWCTVGIIKALMDINSIFVSFFLIESSYSRSKEILNSSFKYLIYYLTISILFNHMSCNIYYRYIYYISVIPWTSNLYQRKYQTSDKN